MAVAEMRKLNLVAMSYDKDRILNALQRTGAAEIKSAEEKENTLPAEDGGDELRAELSRLTGALDLLCAEVGEYNKENKIKSDELKDGFVVSYNDFMSAENLKAEVTALAERVYALAAERKSLFNEISKTEREAAAAGIYSELTEPFEKFRDTARVAVRLGTVPATSTDGLINTAEGDSPFCFNVLGRGGEDLLAVFAWHKSFNGDVLLAEASFSACPYKDGTGVGLCNRLIAEKAQSEARVEEINSEIRSFSRYIKTLKIYCDRIAFELEKREAAAKTRRTQTTFILEAYVPKESEEAVGQALEEVSSAIYYGFTEPAEDEMPPTLYKNNVVVKNFETITNMYSPVNAKEFDPNTVMAFFYSLFLGFIMGDVGYGLLMLLGGGFIYLKKRGEDGGLKRLSGVFAIGGIFAIVWGLLFNSVFGLPVFAVSVLPDAQEARWSLMGIQVPSVLLISLEIGVFHLMVGYICKAIQCMRRGYFWDGILDGLVWTVFSLGVGLAIAGLIDEAQMPLLAYIGGGTAGAMLLVAILTAGRKEKLLGKFTKGFGAAYGIINYASDILSYARLYGLMLSGAVIAGIVSDYSVRFIESGNVALIILAVILMVVGHGFNLAIGLLGAYIHDARLQYVEFYGRFYEGEGELFAPLGSSRKFIKLENSALKQDGLANKF